MDITVGVCEALPGFWHEQKDGRATAVAVLAVTVFNTGHIIAQAACR